MASKVKIPTHFKKKYSRTESTRKENIRLKRKYYLIICEGEKTEPNYFKAFINSLPNGVLNVYDFKIEGSGYNTLSLIKKSIEIKEKWEKEINRKVDKCWIVFDKDNFSDNDFDTAIEKCKSKETIDVAWSNQSFELWYLLHFNYYNTGMDRKNYQKLIEKNLKDKGLKNYKYKKNCPKM